MSLGRDDVTRIVRFCLAGDGWGTASTEDDTCVLKLMVTGGDRPEACRFEGPTFEDALAQAVAAGVLKAACVAKQVAFMTRVSARGGGSPANDADTLPVERGLFPIVAEAVSALVHETQRERGISSLYTASSARRFGDELAAQWRATDRRRRELAAFRERYAGRLPAAVDRHLAAADELLADVAATRRRVRCLSVIPTEVIDAYSRLNGELLRVVDDMTSLVVDAQRMPVALAWIALVNAKEKTGLERAQLVSAFERDRYFDGQYQAVLGLIAARQSYMHLFAAAAPPPASELMREKLGADVTDAVVRMEEIALSHQDGGFGVDPTIWFNAISRQMDLLADVELAVRSSLMR